MLRLKDLEAERDLHAAFIKAVSLPTPQTEDNLAPKSVAFARSEIDPLQVEIDRFCTA